LVADEGTVSADSSEIHLNGAVVIERPASATQAPLRLTTRNVLIHPHDEVAETREHVMLQDPLNTTRAIGMRVQMKDAQLQLLSQVQGHYAPR
jgi:LPS export ABC transporter protein LptC